MKIGVPRESRPGERLVSATPKTVAHLRKLGYEVVVEEGARSSSDCAKPNATSAAATTTPAVTTISDRRDRRSGSTVSTTGTTLSR